MRSMSPCNESGGDPSGGAYHFDLVERFNSGSPHSLVFILRKVQWCRWSLGRRLPQTEQCGTRAMGYGRLGNGAWGADLHTGKPGHSTVDIPLRPSFRSVVPSRLQTTELPPSAANHRPLAPPTSDRIPHGGNGSYERGWNFTANCLHAHVFRFTAHYCTFARRTGAPNDAIALFLQPVPRASDRQLPAITRAVGQSWPPEVLQGAGGGGRRVDSKNSQTTPATTSTSSIRQLLGAADAQTAHHATFSTAPTHQLLGSANAETTPARAPAAAADRKQQPDATCEGKNG